MNAGELFSDFLPRTLLMIRVWGIQIVGDTLGNRLPETSDVSSILF